jgi:hypothetical protein
MSSFFGVCETCSREGLLKADEAIRKIRADRCQYVNSKENRCKELPDDEREEFYEAVAANKTLDEEWYRELSTRWTEEERNNFVEVLGRKIWTFYNNNFYYGIVEEAALAIFETAMSASHFSCAVKIIEGGYFDHEMDSTRYAPMIISSVDTVHAFVQRTGGVGQLVRTWQQPWNVVKQMSVDVYRYLTTLPNVNTKEYAAWAATTGNACFLSNGEECENEQIEKAAQYRLLVDRNAVDDIIEMCEKGLLSCDKVTEMIHANADSGHACFISNVKQLLDRQFICGDDVCHRISEREPTQF